MFEQPVLSLLYKLRHTSKSINNQNSCNWYHIDIQFLQKHSLIYTEFFSLIPHKIKKRNFLADDQSKFGCIYLTEIQFISIESYINMCLHCKLLFVLTVYWKRTTVKLSNIKISNI